MDLNLMLITSSGELNRGIASDLQIRQLIDLNMEDEKRLNHNRSDMERYSYRATRLTKGERRVLNTSGKPVQGNTGRINLVLRAIGIKG